MPYAENGRVLFTAKEFEIYLSEDATKTRYIEGGQRRKAHHFSELLIPTTDPAMPESIYRLKPKYKPMKASIFLQLADVMVYLFSHAHSGDNAAKYHANRVKRKIRHTFEFSKESIWHANPNVSQ